MRPARRSGFTLIEMLCVVAMVGVLAALAIPDFLAHQGRAQQNEAQITLHAIAHQARVARKGGHALEPCGPTPAKVPGPKGVRFEPDDCWRALGVKIPGTTHYQLRLEVDAEGAFTVVARGDVDADGGEVELSLREAEAVVRTSTIGAL